MNGYRNCLVAIGVLFTLNLQLPVCSGQSTAFTYQGRLNDGVAPANGTYDLQFAVFDAAGNGNLIASPFTNSAVPVSNGLFRVALNFGVFTFNGADRWMEISVRTNGAPNFTTLGGRQPITPTPYAIQALNASSVAASNITGSVPLAQLPTGIAMLNSNQTFNGANVFTQPTTFSNNVNIGGPGLGISPFSVQGAVPYSNSGVIHAMHTGGPPGSSAVYGLSLVPAGTGVYGESDTDGGAGGGHPAGVVGVTGATNGYGVYGYSYYGSALAGQFLGNTYMSGKLGIGALPQSGVESLQVDGGVLASGGPPGPFGTNNNGYAFQGTGDNDSGMFSLGNGEVEIFNNSVEAMRIANGSVGIGTSNPQAPLDVIGMNAFPQMRIAVPSNSPYGAFLSIDASSTTNGKNYYIFSSGNSAGEGQGKLIFLNQSQGIYVMTLTSNGNVGIGTLAPQSKLQVMGNIQLGNGAGTNYAASGQENLRIVRGTVNGDGTISKGSGFTVSHPLAGGYLIAFAPGFSDAPTVTATAQGTQTRVVGATVTGVGIQTFDNTGTGSDDVFNFIAVGPP